MTHGAFMPSEFQSTLSVRRATADAGDVETRLDISIHALRKESDAGRIFRHRTAVISIHALRKESDGSAISGWLLTDDFNPRSP